jgi:5-methylcytosine-specific restriction endonuclease McrA
VSWAALRVQVYRRDGGICQVCLARVGRRWDVGHLVDRCVGGPDTLGNCVAMCEHCNRRRKPIHRTLEEALGWVAEQQRASRSGRETQDWRPFLQAMFGR